MHLNLLFIAFLSLISVLLASHSPYIVSIHWTNGKKIPSALKIHFLHKEEVVLVALKPGQDQYLHEFNDGSEVSKLFAIELTWGIKRAIYQIRRGNFFYDENMTPKSRIFINTTPEKWRETPPPEHGKLRKLPPPNHKANL
jgi:hypothetical protein